MKGNLFDFAIMKTSVISPEFRTRYLGNGDSFECRAVVFDGSTDYHDRINDPALGIDEQHDSRDPRVRARSAGRARPRS